MLKIIDTGRTATRFDADKVARVFNCGRLSKHSELDAYKKQGGLGAFWAREWSVNGVLIEKGKDLVDERTGVLVPCSDIEKANKARIESGKSAIVGVNGVFFLIDPEAFTRKNLIWVAENPKISVVENAQLSTGGWGTPDPETKIAVFTARMDLDALSDDWLRRNYFNDGVCPLVRGDIYLRNFDWRYVGGFYQPSRCFGVLTVAEDAKD